MVSPIASTSAHTDDDATRRDARNRLRDARDDGNEPPVRITESSQPAILTTTVAELLHHEMFTQLR